MRQRVSPSSREVRLSDDDLIVSKTDTKGHITYANRTFMQIAGYSELELLGQPHNIVRHPDMPRGVFKLMWSALQSGQEFLGYAKNLCKDGSYYWVLANVTPDLDAAGKVRGYHSARRRPSAQGVATITPIYQQMLELERQAKGQESMTRSLAYLESLLQSHGGDYSHFILDLMRQEI